MKDTVIPYKLLLEKAKLNNGVEHENKKSYFVPDFSSQFTPEKWTSNYLKTADLCKTNPIDLINRIKLMATCYKVMLNDDMEYHDSYSVIQRKKDCAKEIVHYKELFLSDYTSPEDNLMQQYAIFMIGFSYIILGDYQEAIKTYKWYIDSKSVRKQISYYLDNGFESCDYFSITLVLGALRNIRTLYILQNCSDYADALLYSNHSIISRYINQCDRVKESLRKKGEKGAEAYLVGLQTKYISETDILYIASLEELESELIGTNSINSILDARIKDNSLLENPAEILPVFHIERVGNEIQLFSDEYNSTIYKNNWGM